MFSFEIAVQAYSILIGLLKLVLLPGYGSRRGWPLRSRLFRLSGSVGGSLGEVGHAAGLGVAALQSRSLVSSIIVQLEKISSL